MLEYHVYGHEKPLHRNSISYLQEHIIEANRQGFESMTVHDIEDFVKSAFDYFKAKGYEVERHLEEIELGPDDVMTIEEVEISWDRDVLSLRG